MKHKAAVSAFILPAVLLGLICVQAISACDQIPAGETFRIRLLQPVASYSSKPGDLVRGILIESPRCDGLPMFADGTVVEGHVESVHKVGMGIRHETATLEIEFDRILPDGAPPIEMRARVLQVDNAREKVIDGVIHGIRSTNTPQDHLSSRVEYIGTWDPDTLWILPVYRAVFPIFPEPELYFRPGTDFSLELTAPLPVASVPAFAPANRDFGQPEKEDLDHRALSFPERTSTPKGQAADVVNLAFIGSRAQLQEAFTAAGWKSSEAMSGRAAFREIHAFLMLKNDPQGPMTKQLLQGHPTDLTWEKGLDSIAKRDHLRIWSAPDTWQGESVWLSAATREIGASLSLRRRKFIHRVDSNIDEERERVVLDLTLAGCVDSVHEAPRPAMPHSIVNATGREMQTDGAVAFVQLKDCDDPLFKHDAGAPELASRPRSRFARYIRTQVLSSRDVWRENAVYATFDLTRMSVRAIHRSYVAHQNRDQNEALRRASAILGPGLSTGQINGNAAR